MNGRISRRHFLAVAVAAAGSMGARRAPGANDVVSVGCIGLGARGTELLADLLGRSDVRVTAVCDAFRPRLERAQAFSGAVACRDWTELIARDDVDAVVIATPDHWHAPMAVAAIEAGKDVYCERPMALDIEQAKAVRDAAARTRRVVQIGVQETSEGQWHTARDRVLAPGRLGPIRWSQGSYSPMGSKARACGDPVSPETLDWKAFLGPAPERPFDPRRFLAWRNYWDYSGGIAMDLHYHKLAPLLMALDVDLPERVSAAGGLYARDGREVPDAFVMTAEYGGGHTVVLASSVATRKPLPAVVRGRDATLYAEGNRLRIVSETDGAEEALPVEPRPDHLSDWLDGVRTRRQPVCDAELGYRTTVAIAMGVRAYREGRTLVWDRARQAALPLTQPTRLA